MISSKLRITALGLTAGLLLTAGVHAQSAADMSFFLTSVPKGDGANLGGLEGAERLLGRLVEETVRAHVRADGGLAAPAVFALILGHVVVWASFRGASALEFRVGGFWRHREGGAWRPSAYAKVESGSLMLSPLSQTSRGCKAFKDRREPGS